MPDEHIMGLSLLIDALPYPVSVHDKNFNIVLANKGFLDICGKGDRDVIGKKCHELIHCKNLPVKDCPLKKSLQSGRPEKAEIFEPLIGKHLLVHASPIFREGALLGIAHSIMDITGIKESEKVYQELSEIMGTSLEEVKKKEETLQRSRDAFLNMLEDVSESYKDLEELFMSVVRVMVNALDAKSPWTKGHSMRVAMYAEEIAREMGFDEDELKNIRLAGLLHDIGKIGTYDQLLDKPARLTAAEFAVVMKHPSQGAEILKEIKQLKEIIPIIRHHHERIDGKGYPAGLTGEDIPLEARIMHVADSFDSMTADRPYRPSPGKEYAVSELTRCSGTQFDNQVVEVFLKLLHKD
jgi:putative nucleotidyltransferase with HDIG domain/PAS domain S-box-containing protein